MEKVARKLGYDFFKNIRTFSRNAKPKGSVTNENYYVLSPPPFILMSQ